MTVSAHGNNLLALPLLLRGVVGRPDGLRVTRVMLSTTLAEQHHHPRHLVCVLSGSSLALGNILCRPLISEQTRPWHRENKTLTHMLTTVARLAAADALHPAEPVYSKLKIQYLCLRTANALASTFFEENGKRS